MIRSSSAASARRRRPARESSDANSTNSPHALVDLGRCRCLCGVAVDAEEQRDERCHGGTDQMRARVRPAAVFSRDRRQRLVDGERDRRELGVDEVVRQRLLEQPLVVAVGIGGHVAEEASRN